MSRPSPDPVVVVGLGPVGATVALLLVRQGVRVVAVEREPEPYPHPRAVALDDDALRVLQAAGVLDDLALHVGGTVRLRGADGTPLVELPAPPTRTGHPALAFFRQPQLEGLLRAALAREPLATVRLGVDAVGIEQDATSATVLVRTPGGGPELERLRASHVLACDGGRSGVRGALGVRLVGRTSGRRWLVVDTAAPEAGGDAGPATPDAVGGGAGSAAASAARPGFAPADFEFACDPRRPWVHGPLPGGEHRWEFLLGAHEEAAAVAPAAVVGDLLARRAGGPAPAVRRAAVYAFHARVAARWRVGRVLLLGDAAHLAPPFAGQGLGAGLRDAHNVAWKVAAVVRGEASERLLGSYPRERRPHVVRMTALASALGAVVQVRRRRVARARDAAMRGLLRRDRIRAWAVGGGWKPPSTIARGVLAPGRLAGRAGEAWPQAPVGRAGGAGSMSDARGAGDIADARGAGDIADARGVGGVSDAGDETLGPGWALVGVGRDPGATLPAEARATAARLRTRTVAADAIGAAWLAPATVALVRPDRVVFGTGAAGDAAALLRAAAAALGRP